MASLDDQQQHPQHTQDDNPQPTAHSSLQQIYRRQWSNDWSRANQQLDTSTSTAASRAQTIAEYGSDAASLSSSDIAAIIADLSRTPSPKGKGKGKGKEKGPASPQTPSSGSDSDTNSSTPATSAGSSSGSPTPVLSDLELFLRGDDAVHHRGRIVSTATASARSATLADGPLALYYLDYLDSDPGYIVLKTAAGARTPRTEDVAAQRMSLETLPGRGYRVSYTRVGSGSTAPRKCGRGGSPVRRPPCMEYYAARKIGGQRSRERGGRSCGSMALEAVRRVGQAVAAVFIFLADCGRGRVETAERQPLLG